MVHEEHGNVLARYQTMEVTTGAELMNQFQPFYLGVAHPFTMPMAVGGYDVPGKDRWRRPVWEDISTGVRGTHRREANNIPLVDDFLRMQDQVEPAKVKLFDLTRGLPRRVEAQFRRHWHFVPGLWNLHFREQLNTGGSLSAVARAGPAEPLENVEQDAAMAAADLYEKLHTGWYQTQTGKRRRIDGDVSKLRWAVGVTPTQRRLLGDYDFRARASWVARRRSERRSDTSASGVRWCTATVSS